jgi:hypothetical protein
LALRAAEKPVILPLGPPEERAEARLRRVATGLATAADVEWFAAVCSTYLDPYARCSFD